MKAIDNIICFFSMQKWTPETILQDFTINALPVILIFLLGYSWKIVGNILDYRSMRKLFGVGFEKTGITVAISSFDDTRMLTPEAQKEIGIDPPQHVGPKGKRFIKRHVRHFVVFPGGEDLVALASTRAAGYINEKLPKLKRLKIMVSSDQEIASKRDGTFVCIGSSGTNIKSDQIKHSPENIFLGDDLGNVIKLRNGKEFNITDREDKAYIMKIINPSFPDNASIVCAGLGEWGSSGAAWYLSKNWKLITRKYGNKPFLLILSVEHGSDESAHEIYSM